MEKKYAIGALTNTKQRKTSPNFRAGLVSSAKAPLKKGGVSTAHKSVLTSSTKKRKKTPGI